MRGDGEARRPPCTPFTGQVLVVLGGLTPQKKPVSLPHSSGGDAWDEGAAHCGVPSWGPKARCGLGGGEGPV